MPKVSVVIPCYNRADLIGETLESVRVQTFTEWECIVVDDGSTDGTREVVESFVARDPRFRYVRQENAGVAAARNRGISLARGEYVGFLDSDDHFAPDRLEWQVAALDSDPGAVLVYGNTLNCWSSDMRRGEIYLADRVEKPSGWAFEELICCSSIYAPLVRASALAEVGGFDDRMIPGEDWDMWLRISRAGKILFDPRIHLYYRVHEGNVSSDSLRMYGVARRIASKHLRGLPLRERARLYRRVRTFLREGYAPQLLAEAVRRGDMGDWAAARQHWRALATLDPRLLLQPRVLLNTLWALLPTDAEPPWRALRRRWGAAAQQA